MGTHSLNLLARHPGPRYRGLGRTVLTRWIEAIGYGACWLQTSDLDSPATRLYTSLGFQTVGHGPEAPNGEPGLVLLRPTGPPSQRVTPRPVPGPSRPRRE